ncbi:MAG: GAF domain-containing protein [Glaciecola sp.]|jgi:GAF domain-containing protein|nr:GAF domain-containing protein [Glaciecola sp.]MDG1814760.1 GAF domain-containing protein [Glaciecola sp.]MDG2098905.1 GAF domain-containing protein [Glaciecola sp.]
MTNYDTLNQQALALLGDEPDVVANLANISSLLFNELSDINWAGFYLYKYEQLVLGPFQGRPACIRIPMGKGVCGTAAQTLTTQRITDVHEFPGHIACDAASNSEIVLPLVVNGSLFGVLDIDAPIFDRFSVDDEAGLTQLAVILVNHLEKTGL